MYSTNESCGFYHHGDCYISVLTYRGTVSLWKFGVPREETKVSAQGSHLRTTDLISFLCPFFSQPPVAWDSISGLNFALKEDSFRTSPLIHGRLPSLSRTGSHQERGSCVGEHWSAPAGCCLLPTASWRGRDLENPVGFLLSNASKPGPLEETSQQEECPKVVSLLGFLPTTLRWSWAERTRRMYLERKSRYLK